MYSIILRTFSYAKHSPIANIEGFFVNIHYQHPSKLSDFSCMFHAFYHIPRPLVQIYIKYPVATSNSLSCLLLKSNLQYLVIFSFLFYCSAAKMNAGGNCKAQSDVTLFSQFYKSLTDKNLKYN